MFKFALELKPKMKKIRTFLVLLCLTASINLGYSQGWKFYRHEINFGAGVSNFLGELGGAPGIGTNGWKDLRFNSTRFVTTLGYKYMVHPYFSVRGNFYLGMLSGSDANTDNEIRYNRNLSFRSMLYELSVLAEVYPFRERNYHAYRLRGLKGKNILNLSPYVFVGISVIGFNPKAELNGQWYALQPLGTEGQGLGNNPDKYSRVSLAFPMGVGLKYAINKKWSVSFEFSGRYTITDYIDDVSTTYYHEDEITANYGQVAGQLQNRALNPQDGWFGVVDNGDGTYNYLQRGDETDDDAYIFAIFSVHYRFLKGRRFIPKF